MQSLENLVRLLVAEFKVEIRLAIYLVAFIVLFKVTHIDIRGVCRTIIREAKDFAGVKFTVGSMNVLNLIVILVGVLVLVLGIEGTHIFKYISSIVGKEKTTFLNESGLEYGIVTLGLFAWLSVWAFMRVEIERIRTSRKR